MGCINFFQSNLRNADCFQTVSDCAAGGPRAHQAACDAAYMLPDPADYDVMGLFDLS